MEPTEIREEVKEEFDRQEKKEQWINYLALTTVILAVCRDAIELQAGTFLRRIGPQTNDGLRSVGFLSGQGQ